MPPLPRVALGSERIEASGSLAAPALREAHNCRAVSRRSWRRPHAGSRPSASVEHTAPPVASRDARGPRRARRARHLSDGRLASEAISTLRFLTAIRSLPLAPGQGRSAVRAAVAGAAQRSVLRTQAARAIQTAETHLLSERRARRRRRRRASCCTTRRRSCAASASSNRTKRAAAAPAGGDGAARAPRRLQVRHAGCPTRRSSRPSEHRLAEARWHSEEFDDSSSRTLARGGNSTDRRRPRRPMLRPATAATVARRRLAAVVARRDAHGERAGVFAHGAPPRPAVRRDRRSGDRFEPPLPGHRV